jgi:hypothetical protein
MRILFFLFFVSCLSIFSLDYFEPIFAIYSGEYPIYGTINGAFSLFPIREKKKYEEYSLSTKEWKNISGTSYATIKINDEYFPFYQIDNLESDWSLDENHIKLKSFIKSKNLLIGSTLKSIPSKPGSFLLSYDFENLDSKEVSVGLRLLLDVSTPSNEGFKLRLFNANQKDFFNHEVKFTPFQSHYWETDFDPKKKWKIRNYLIGEGLTPPDKIAFTNWKTSFDSIWDYFTKKKISILDDSAVILWWEPKKIQSGKKLSFHTEFEIRKFQLGHTIEVINPKTGYARLHLGYENKTNLEQNIEYSLAVSNGFILKDKPLEFKLPAYGILDKTIDIHLSGNGEFDLIIEESINQNSKKYFLPIEIDTDTSLQSPHVIRTDFYPIHYTSNKSGLKLKAILKEKFTNKIIGETFLSETEFAESKYVYTGSIDLKDYIGQVKLEIFSIKSQ